MTHGAFHGAGRGTIRAGKMCRMAAGGHDRTGMSSIAIMAAATGAVARGAPSWRAIGGGTGAVCSGLDRGVAVYIIALSVGCSRIFGVWGGLATVGAVDSSGKAIEFDIDLAIDVVGCIDNRHTAAGRGGMAFGAGNGIQFCKIYMFVVAATFNNRTGSIVCPMAAGAVGRHCRPTPCGNNIG